MTEDNQPNAQAEQSAAPDTQPQAPDGNAQPTSADNKQRAQFDPQQQAIVNGIVQERLARERDKIEKQARERFESELAEQKRQAELSEQERVKEQQAQLEQERKQLEQERQQIRRSQQLSGKVVDVDKALRLVEDAHLNEDGTLDVDKFLADNPFLQQQPQRTPTTAANVATTRASNPKQERSSKMNDFLRRSFE